MNNFAAGQPAAKLFAAAGALYGPRLPMPGSRMRAIIPALLLALATAANAQTVTQRLEFDHALPTVPGKSLRNMVIAFAPGASLPPHDHAPSAFLYHRVLEGAVRSSLNGWPVQVYGAGEGFYEKPGDAHEVFANASDTQPAKVLVVIVMDTAEQEPGIPAK